MKNIQIIDGADNCVYDVFQVDERDFALVFPEGQDIAFIDEVVSRQGGPALDAAFARMWTGRVHKRDAQGIHGLLFYGMDHKKPYYPDRTDQGARNPDGSALRAEVH